ncbi:MAG: dienelactone hydrolase [Chloroflexi bacterium]|nr:dienelactone hydrolase [Chloroflexota bacterium]MBP8057647.1 dienelactone hydrolase [Chloroflexota bacterium]
MYGLALCLPLTGSSGNRLEARLTPYVRAGLVPAPCGATTRVARTPRNPEDPIKPMSVRALYRQTKLENIPAPYDTLTLKVFYPARLGDTAEERNAGIIPADTAMAPFPVLIFMPEVNCGPESYQWLAEQLARRGIVTITYSYIAEDIPGTVSLTPGMNIQALRPQIYGTLPSSAILPALLQTLAQLQVRGVLAGLLRLDSLILGGHAAGGTLALQNANRQWFPQVAAAFSYAAHTKAPTMLGYAADTILPLSGDVPLLIMGGTRDGVIAGSVGRYEQSQTHNWEPLERTFREGVPDCGRNDISLLILEGANHYLPCHPQDKTTGRPFLDLPADENEVALRYLLGDAIEFFIEGVVLDNAAAQERFNQLITEANPLIALSECK